jgi:hypothetical protein
MQVTTLSAETKIVKALHLFSHPRLYRPADVEHKSAGHRHGGASRCAAMSGVLFTEPLGKSFKTLACQSVRQANHDLAGRVQPN